MEHGRCAGGQCQTCIGTWNSTLRVIQRAVEVRAAPEQGAVARLLRDQQDLGNRGIAGSEALESGCRGDAGDERAGNGCFCCLRDGLGSPWACVQSQIKARLQCACLQGGDRSAWHEQLGKADMSRSGTDARLHNVR